ncbi:MAG TPA: hypothetical protein VFR97_02255, partial [Capillimicrobium sp.]|nr:hypothetical protein [Capillimicrobium sp.]
EAGRVAGRLGAGLFEIIFKLTEWRGRPVYAVKTLDLRRTQSIERWIQDGPDLVAVEQFVPGQGRVTIPAEDLVYYRFGAEGDNWEGESLLRPAYKHWQRKEGLELMQAQALERSGKGVPTGYPPTQANQDDLDAFEQFLTDVGSDNAGYFLAPGPHAENADTGQGWRWEFVTPKDAKGSAEGYKVAIDGQSDKIAAAVLQEFMRQGMSKVGTNATAETQQNPFLLMCEALATIVFEAPLNEQLVPRILDANGMRPKRMPKIRCSLIDETTLEELAGYVAQLAEKGAIRPEPTLEAYLRQRADLPPADEDALREQEEAEHERERELLEARGGGPRDGDGDGTVQEKDAPARKANATRTLRRADRDLKAHELHMSLDRIETAIDGARDRIQQAAGPAVHAVCVELAQRAAAGRAVSHGKPPEQLVDALEQEVRHLYEQGRLSVREELQRQSSLHIEPPVTLGRADDVARFLRDVAVTAATNIAAAIVSELLRLRARQRPGEPAVDVAVYQQAAEEAARGAIRHEAQTNASAVVNAGRSDQADDVADLIAGSRYTSILDGNRCDECRRADDDVLRPLDDPVRVARKPPNRMCAGGGRCRCMEAFQLRDEAAPAI